MGTTRRDFLKNSSVAAGTLGVSSSAIDLWAMSEERKRLIVEGTFYVASSGKDEWSGKLPDPNSANTDGPFATLQRARNAVRDLKGKSAPKEAITVIVRSGKYFLQETLVFGSEDSGSAEFPVSYRAAAGERITLSGGTRVSGWKPYKGQILQATFPRSTGEKSRFRQLFFNGQRQIRARYPNFDPANPIFGGWLYTQGRATTAKRAFNYKTGALPRHWAKPREAEVCLHVGQSNTIPIESIDERNCLITLKHEVKDWSRLPYAKVPIYIGMDPDGPEAREGVAFYVENVLEELDQPGEWCLDDEDGMLYFWPPEPKPIERAEIVVPTLDCLIDLQDVSWITIAGFTFTETTSGDNMHREGNEGYGAFGPGAGEGKQYCGEALHMKGTEHCRIEDNHFYAVGGNAIYVEDYNFRNVIANNEISNAGDIGICLIGTKYFSDIFRPRIARHYPMYQEVSNNHIHHCGVFDKNIAGIYLGLSDGNLIAHNLIEQMPHHAINLGNSQYGRNIVEYNEIRHACLQTRDNGAINVWGEDPDGHIRKDAERSGYLIRYNLIADLHGIEMSEKDGLVPSVWMKSAIEGFTHGIYLDNFTSNCFVYGNIIIRCGSTGIYIQGGKNNIVENNIIVDVGNMSHMGGWWAPQMGEPSFMTGNRFCRNIFYRSRGNPPIIFRHIGFKTEPLSDAIAQSDYNLFFSKIGGDFSITESSSFLFPELPTQWPHLKVVPLAEWQKEGMDAHSLIADPRFVDPANDDYRLRTDSPALRLGFQPIDATQIGIRQNPR
jgi:parallel beta-helix repeat protein